MIQLREPRYAHSLVAPSPNAAMLNGEGGLGLRRGAGDRSNYFWSPDSSRLAFLQMNESEVPQYPIEDWIPTHARWICSAIRSPATPTPTFAWAWSARGGKTVWVKLPIQAGQDYIPRFGWADRKTCGSKQ